MSTYSVLGTVTGKRETKINQELTSWWEKQRRARGVERL